MLLDSSTLFQIPVLSDDGALVSKSSLGPGPFLPPLNSLSLIGQNGMRLSYGAGGSTRSEWKVCVCVVCDWDRGGTLKGVSTVAKCGLQADPAPHCHPHIFAVRGVRASRNVRGHFASQHPHFLDEVTEAPVFLYLAQLGRTLSCFVLPSGTGTGIDFLILFPTPEGW